ncbi:MAG: MBL fold metallo-hydrolase, partial [Anaerolineae bacterium]|nr:MBL fold metallo-hydrolase [Anaerolineae bacterium]
DRRYVSFMYSYPNFIPLPATAVERIAGALEPVDYDRLYGAWWNRVVMSGAKKAVHQSVRRYIEALNDTGTD